VQNNYAYPVEINWELLSILDKSSGEWRKNPFNVRPASATLKPGDSQSFNFEFVPTEPDQYFF
jgi:hypothetical protein